MTVPVRAPFRSPVSPMIDRSNSSDALDRALAWLCARGVRVPANARAQLVQHAALVRAWNKAVSLVSHGDVRELEARHTADSLSLLPYVADGHGACLVDVGSGAGFPAVPIKVMRPDLRVVLYERSTRKAGFLRQVVGALGLDGVEIVAGPFDGVSVRDGVDVVTARAVERPEALAGAMLAQVARGAVLLGQARAYVDAAGERFHVEPVRDDAAALGLRRGELWLIRRR